MGSNRESNRLFRGLYGLYGRYLGVAKGYLGLRRVRGIPARMGKLNMKLNVGYPKP